MFEQGKDFLVKISDEDLYKLAKLYEEKCVSWAPYMVSFVYTAINWKKFEKYRDDINFWSPRNSWEKDGTIVATLKNNNCLDVYLFTLNEDHTSIYTALMQTDLIDFSKRVVFYGIHEKHTPPLLQYLKDKEINIALNIPTYIYAISPEEGKNLSISCPPEVYLKKLNPSAAKQVNDAWPHRFKGSQDYLARFIEVNGGWGVFLKSTNEMVAWVLKHAFGHLGMLQTEEKYTRRGYASLVAKVLSKEIAEQGYWPLGTILLKNYPSITMFEKMGFRNIGICSFIAVKPNNKKSE